MIGTKVFLSWWFLNQIMHVCNMLSTELECSKMTGSTSYCMPCPLSWPQCDWVKSGTSYQGPKARDKALYCNLIFSYSFEGSICLLFHILYSSSPEAAGKLFLEVERERSFEGVSMKSWDFLALSTHSFPSAQLKTIDFSVSIINFLLTCQHYLLAVLEAQFWSSNHKTAAAVLTNGLSGINTGWNWIVSKIEIAAEK